MMAFFRTSILIPALLFAVACNTQKPDSTSEVDRAIYLIDTGQANEAIFTMQNYVQNNPYDERARLVLASAYAASIGLNLTQFSLFATNIIQWDKDSKAVAALPKGNDPDLTALNSAFQKLYGVTRLLKSIPLIRSSDQRLRLEYAIATLGGDSKIYGGASMYRGSLKIVLFKDNLIRRDNLVAGRKGCQASNEAAARWLGAIQKDLVDALLDLAFGLSDKQSQAHIVSFSVALRKAIGVVSDQGNWSSRDNSVLTFRGVLSDIYPQCS